jgi:hypothetical protein
MVTKLAGSPARTRNRSTDGFVAERFSFFNGGANEATADRAQVPQVYLCGSRHSSRKFQTPAIIGRS